MSQAAAETDLALALGFPAEDRVRAVAQERPLRPAGFRTAGRRSRPGFQQ